MEPLIVTTILPVVGRVYGEAPRGRGASYETHRIGVDVLPFRERDTGRAAPVRNAARHRMEVSEKRSELSQAVRPMAARGAVPCEPKFLPRIVVTPSKEGTLAGDMTRISGKSNEKNDNREDADVATEAKMTRSPPDPDAERQRITESLVHDVRGHAVAPTRTEEV